MSIKAIKRLIKKSKAKSKDLSRQQKKTMDLYRYQELEDEISFVEGKIYGLKLALQEVDK